MEEQNWMRRQFMYVKTHRTSSTYIIIKALNVIKPSEHLKLQTERNSNRGGKRNEN